MEPRKPPLKNNAYCDFAFRRGVCKHGDNCSFAADQAGHADHHTTRHADRDAIMRQEVSQADKDRKWDKRVSIGMIKVLRHTALDHGLHVEEDGSIPLKEVYNVVKDWVIP